MIPFTRLTAAIKDLLQSRLSEPIYRLFIDEVNSIVKPDKKNVNQDGIIDFDRSMLKFFYCLKIHITNDNGINQALNPISLL